MSRYFKTESINPQNDFMYKAPHELMMKALEVQQQGHDTALAQATIFDNLDIKHINDPNVQKRVNEIKSTYEDKANEIVDQIKADPTKWKKMSPHIRKLASDLQNDMTSGSIAGIQGSYSNLQKFMTDNKDKDKRVMAQAMNYYMNDYSKRVSENPDTYMSFDDVVNPVDMMSDKYQKILKEIKANKSTKTDGMYFYKGEEISAAKVEQVAYNLLMSDPEYQAYAQQQMKFGDTGFVDIDEEGNVTAKPIYAMFDKAGNKLTQEDAERLHEEWAALPTSERTAESYPIKNGLNGSHAMAGSLKALGSAYSMFQQDMSVNEYGVKKVEHGYRTAENAQKDRFEKENLHIKHQYDTALEGLKYDNEVKKILLNNKLTGEDKIFEMKKKIAETKPGTVQDQLNDLLTQMVQHDITGEVWQDPNLKLFDPDGNGVLNKANMGDKSFIQFRADARQYGRSQTGYKAGSKEHTRQMVYDKYLAKGLTPEQAMKNTVNESYKTEILSQTRNGKQVKFSSDKQMDEFRKDIESQLKTYTNHMNDFVTKLANSSSEVVLNPLNYGASNQISQIVGNTPSAFRMLDEKGIPIKDFNISQLDPKKLNVTHVYGTNPYDAIGYSGTYDGKKVKLVASDKTSTVATNARNTVLLSGMKYEDNSLVRSMSNRDLQEIESKFWTVNADNNGNKTVAVPIGPNHFLRIQQSKVGTVKYSIDDGYKVNFNTDPKSGNYNTAPDLATLMETIGGLQKFE